MPGVFAKRVDDLPPAAQQDGPRAPARLRRLATAAAWTVMDSVQHNFFVPGDSVALRGGTVDFEQLEEGVSWTLGGARFTEDVTLDGTWFQIGEGWDGEFTVTGPGGTATTMHVGGPFLTDGEHMTITTRRGR